MSTDDQNRAGFAAGKPADAGQLILQRRLRLVQQLGGIPEKSLESSLDAGCGNGAQTALLATLAKRQFGVDIMPENIQAAQSRIPGGTFTQSALEKLPFDDQQFDLVTCFEVLEHVDDDVQSMRELIRVTKRGGVLAISLPSKWWVFETHGCKFEGVLGKLPWNRAPFVISWLPERWHDAIAKARIYSKARGRKLVEQAGVELIAHRYVTAPMDMIPWRGVRELVRKLIFRGDSTALPVLATSHLFVLRKL